MAQHSLFTDTGGDILTFFRLSLNWPLTYYGGLYRRDGHTQNVKYVKGGIIARVLGEPEKWKISCHTSKQGRHSHQQFWLSTCESLSPKGTPEGEES